MSFIWNYRDQMWNFFIFFPNMTGCKRTNDRLSTSQRTNANEQMRTSANTCKTPTSHHKSFFVLKPSTLIANLLNRCPTFDFDILCWFPFTVEAPLMKRQIHYLDLNLISLSSAFPKLILNNESLACESSFPRTCCEIDEFNYEANCETNNEATSWLHYQLLKIILH